MGKRDAERDSSRLRASQPQPDRARLGSLGSPTALHLLCQAKRRARGYQTEHKPGRAGLQQDWSWCLTCYSAGDVFLLRSLLGCLSLPCALFCGQVTLAHPRQTLSLQNDGQVCHVWVHASPAKALIFGWEVFAPSFDCFPAPSSSST